MQTGMVQQAQLLLLINHIMFGTEKIIMNGSVSDTKEKIGVWLML